MKSSVLLDKSKAFAIRIIRMVEYIQSNKKEYIVTNQVLRSGTSIGANAREAFFAQSLKDFITKLYNSRKECGETQYWLELLYETGKINDSEFVSIYNDCGELGRILTSSVKTAISKLPNNKRKKYLVEEPSFEYGSLNVFDIDDINLIEGPEDEEDCE